MLENLTNVLSILKSMLIFFLPYGPKKWIREQLSKLFSSSSSSQQRNHASSERLSLVRSTPPTLLQTEQKSTAKHYCFQATKEDVINYLFYFTHIASIWLHPSPYFELVQRQYSSPHGFPSKKVDSRWDQGFQTIIEGNASIPPLDKEEYRHFMENRMASSQLLVFV